MQNVLIRIFQYLSTMKTSSLLLGPFIDLVLLTVNKYQTEVVMGYLISLWRNALWYPQVLDLNHY